MALKKSMEKKADGEEKIFLYFPIFSLVFLMLLALFGVKGSYALDEGSKGLLFWSFFFVFLLFPLALQVVLLKKMYNIAQVLPTFSAFGGYALYYINGDWFQFLFFIATVLLGVGINFLGRKKSKEG